MATHNFVTFDATTQQLCCYHQWHLPKFIEINQSLKKIKWPSSGQIIINGDQIEAIDSAGAWLLIRWMRRLTHNGLQVSFENFSEKSQKLIEIIQKNAVSPNKIPRPKSMNAVAKLGKYTIDSFIELRDFFAFVGFLGVEFIQMIFKPWVWRWNSLASVIIRTGCQALPIIALLSFMIGVVISYQMGNQLRAYGANVFIVDLLGLSVLREFGPLITAIMVAGRTGSAFTAQLGIMKLNQEIDALNTMGITPARLLLLPRIIGLTIALPLLTVWADIFGVFGGMIMANNMLDISWYEFLDRFQYEIPVRAFIIGLGKAPVFALLISSIGCFEGMQVKGSAESVGLLTTRSVVLAIFFIIVTDAVFSVIFSKLQL